MNYLLKLLRGAADALTIAPNQRNYRLDPHGFATDARHLRGDFAAVGKDMRKALKRESADYRAR